MTFSEPLVATAYYAYSTHLLSEMATVLGRQEENEKYSSLYEKVKRVYNKYFINENGHIIAFYSLGPLVFVRLWENQVINIFYLSLW